MLDLALTSDQEQLVATVRDFCAREFAPTIQANDRAGRHDPEIFAKLATIGLPGVCFPQRYGGVGLDYLPYPGENGGISLVDPDGKVIGAQEVRDDAPSRALAFKVINDQFGTLTFVRVYSGVIKKGDASENKTAVALLEQSSDKPV